MSKTPNGKKYAGQAGDDEAAGELMFEDKEKEGDGQEMGSPGRVKQRHVKRRCAERDSTVSADRGRPYCNILI